MSVNTALYDGRKTVTLWGDEGWTYLTGTPDTDDKNANDYFRVVPWLYRGMTLRADAVGAMPFALVDSNGEDYDTSADWENKCGFLPNPMRLLWLVEASLTLTGRAYLWRSFNRVRTIELRYLSPYTIEPVLDKAQGLTGFKRNISGVPKAVKIEDLIYLWLPDMQVEIGPPLSCPGLAALAASGALNSMDTFIKGYFERGAIKATLLTVKGQPAQAEREKIESYWRQFLTGIKGMFAAKVMNAEMVTPITIGDGVKDLENQSLTNEKREDIATALGVPQTMLFSNAANYATAQQDDQHFYSKTIVPECAQIAAVLNEQLFKPLNLTLEFRPETLEVFQQEESERSGALNQLVQAGVPTKLAMEILGYDLSEEQWAELDNKPEPVTVTSPPVEEVEEEPESEELYSEMRLWKRKALNAMNKGRSPAVPFVSEAIPAEQHARISQALALATTAEEVKAAFAINQEPEQEDPAIKALIENIQLGIQSLNIGEPE